MVELAWQGLLSEGLPFLLSSFEISSHFSKGLSSLEIVLLVLEERALERVVAQVAS